MLDNLPASSGRERRRHPGALAIALLLHAAVAVAVVASYGRDTGPGPGEQVRGVANVSGPVPQPEAAGSASPVRPAGAARQAPSPASEDIVGRAFGVGAGTSGLVIPDTIRLGRPYEISFRLPPIPAARTPAIRDEAGRLRPVQLSRVRQATLAGQDFVVEARTPGLQLADSAAATVWRWTVIPTEPGTRTLQLRVDAVVAMRGEEQIQTLGTWTREVTVRATRAQQVARWAAENWWWVWILALVPLIGWMRARRRERIALRSPAPRTDR